MLRLAASSPTGHGVVRTSNLAWRKSQASGTGNCVQVAVRDDQVVVRDSKDPDGPILTFTATEWDCFLVGVREGEFDRPRLLAWARAWSGRVRLR